MTILRQSQTPWGTGCEVGAGVPCTAGLMLRWPPDPGQDTGRCVVLTAAHAFANLARLDDPYSGRVGIPVGQPHGARTVGHVLALIGARLHTTADDSRADDSDLAVIELSDLTPATQVGGRRCVSGAAIDAALDTFYHQALTDPTHGPANWLAAPRYYQTWDNRPCVLTDGVLTHARYPAGLGRAHVGERIWLTGARSGTLHGTVTSVGLTQWIYWTDSRCSRFAGLCCAEMDDGRGPTHVDSGAAVWNAAGQCVGGLVSGGAGRALWLPYQPALRHALGPIRATALRLED